MTAWITPADRAAFSAVPGEFSDDFGSENEGPAIAIGDVIIEAPTVDTLRAMLIQMSNLLPEDENRPGDNSAPSDCEGSLAPLSSDEALGQIASLLTAPRPHLRSDIRKVLARVSPATEAPGSSALSADHGKARP